jgi:hypothetical protein
MCSDIFQGEHVPHVFYQGNGVPLPKSNMGEQRPPWQGLKMSEVQWMPFDTVQIILAITYLQIYLAMLAIHNIVVKYNLLIFSWGMLYLQTILTHILVSGIVDILRLSW